MSLRNQDTDCTDWTDHPSDADNPPTGFPITRTVGWVDLDSRGTEDPIIVAMSAIGSDVSAHADGPMTEELTYRFDPSGRGAFPLTVNVARA